MIQGVSDEIQFLAGNIEHFLDEFLIAGSHIVSQDDKLRWPVVIMPVPMASLSTSRLVASGTLSRLREHRWEYLVVRCFEFDHYAAEKPNIREYCYKGSQQ